MADTLTKIAIVASDIANNVTTWSLTIPAGVTTAHLGVMVFSTAAAGTRTATATGWTQRVVNPAGESNMEVTILTRLGGMVAGGTISGTISAAQAAYVSVTWYDSQGRDIEVVGTPWTRNGATLSTITFPSITTSGTRNFLLVGAERTAGTTVTISSWSQAAPVIDLYTRSTDTSVRATGHLFGHFDSSGASPQYVATLSASGTNAVGVLMTVASGNTAPIANAGADQTVEPWSTVTLTGLDTDTENNVTTRAWSQTGVTTTLQSDTFTGTNGAAPSSSNFSLNPTTGATATIQSNQLRLQTGSLGSYNDNMRVSSTLPVTANGRITLDVTPTTTTEAYFIVLVRAQAKDGSLGQDGYKFEVGSWGGITVSKLAAYSGTTIGSSVSIPGYAVNVPVHVDLSFTGNAFQMSAWTGSTQPATPMISVTDAASTYSTGYVGMYLNGGSAASAPATWLVDNWSVTTPGTGVALTNPNTATATFSAPATIAGSSLTFQYTATDSGGLSSSDTMVVTILPVTERAVIGGVEVPMRIA